ncbi:MAG: DegT/DnrJ/EryC1/StrS family aminotransferase [Candidatus Peregrinibacteria bacterium]
MPFFPIHHTFAPHVDFRFLLRTLGLIVRPWKWKHGQEQQILERRLSETFHGDVFLFASGREALLALLRAIGVRAGHEVIVQAYTCVVVPNAIHAAGGVPVYADIDRETLNPATENIGQVITERTHAVICQHTFGIPAPVREIKDLCDRHHLPLIEDCAHILPDPSGPGGILTTGTYAILSFGRDKAISGIAGGAVLSRNAETSEKIRLAQAQATDLPLREILSLLLYPLLYWIARPLYGLFVGKALLWLCRKLHVLPPILEAGEKEGTMSPLLHRMPNACAALALSAFECIQSINDHRRQLVRFYLETCQASGISCLQGITPDLPLQKFPLFVKNAASVRSELKKNNIHLSDGWTGCIICPDSTDLDAANYIPGSDPEAEAACEMILSLPTHPTMTLKQADFLVRILFSLLDERTPVFPLPLPEYTIDAKPNYQSIGAKIDEELEKHFPGKDVAIRALSTTDHPQYSVDELMKIITETGTDKYDRNRKGVEGFENYRVDFQAEACTIGKNHFGKGADFVKKFYENVLFDRGYRLRIDLLLVYDLHQLLRAEKIDPAKPGVPPRLEPYLFRFKNQEHKKEALLGIIKFSR